MKIYIYGAHVKNGYEIEVDSLDLISSNVQSQNQDISKLAKGHRWKYNDVLPSDECNARACGLLQWSEHSSGTVSNRGTYCRIALMNDEVLWQWRTGSVLTYRFESMRDSLAYYCMLFPNAKINTIERINEYEVGDIVKLNRAIVTPLGYKYNVGDIFRVYDVQNGKIIPAGIDGMTYIRLPGTGGSKLHIGYCLIPQEYVTAIKHI